MHASVPNKGALRPPMNDIFFFFFLNRQYVYTVASPRAASDGCNYASIGLERYPSVGTVLKSESEDLYRQVYGGRCICIGPVVISHYG